MAFVLGVADLNSQAIEATLDNELYYIILNWNQTAGYWSMNIRGSSYRTLINGICVSANYPLLWQFKYADLPPGEIMAVTKNYRSGPIPRDGFSSGIYELVYVTEEDILLGAAIAL